MIQTLLFRLEKRRNSKASSHKWYLTMVERDIYRDSKIS